MTSENGRKKALIAMSGGVDSSVAAFLTQEKGIDCMGVTMKLIGEESSSPGDKQCCSLEDSLDAASVCRRLGMRHIVMNFTEDFKNCVIDRFIACYEDGATPNPCIDCNRFLKFGKLFQRAKELSCDYLVTGHYARIGRDEETGRWLLKKAANSQKDQSYVLCFMTQDQLSHTLFPLGEYASKDEIREIAAAHGFVNAKKHDSQDICFVPDSDYAGFIQRETGREYPEGDFVDEEGHVLGRHKGIIRYTIGQRKGLGLSLPAPLYVREKDLKGNRVILSPEDRLFSASLIAEDFNWILLDHPAEGTRIRVTAKPRYRAREASALATVLPGGRVRIDFDEPQRAITRGQTVVLYQGDVVAGGGIISGSEKKY